MQFFSIYIKYMMSPVLKFLSRAQTLIVQIYSVFLFSFSLHSRVQTQESRVQATAQILHYAFNVKVKLCDYWLPYFLDLDQCTPPRAPVFISGLGPISRKFR